MKLRRDAAILKRKAIGSMRSAVEAFNSLSDDARETRVLLSLQHAFEMVLKAILTQNRVAVFDKRTGRSIGLEAAVRQAQALAGVKLTEAESGTIRTIDAMRDDEQHWYLEVEEGLLYLHVRAAVTLFDDLLFRAFGERLAEHLPTRVLPVSTEAPQDFQLLVDREYENVARLLRPGRRVGSEADARIRTLLAMEAHSSEEARVSKTDVSRVRKGIRAGLTRTQVFPKLEGVGADVSGAGTTVEVRFVKHGGLPVTYVKAGAELDRAAIREVDLTAKYHWSAHELTAKLGISSARNTALRRHVGVDGNPDMAHTFNHGKAHFIQYSDNALTAMRTALDHYDLAEIWKAHRPAAASYARPRCTQPECAAPDAA